VVPAVAVTRMKMGRRIREVEVVNDPSVEQGS
jgi:hypothetical protein